MTTSHVDRLVLREWRDSHDDVQPDRDGHACSRWVWMDGPIGECGRTSAWFGRGRPFCEQHMVERIKRWSEDEIEVSA
jgi:hypothetical protein